MIAAWDSLHHAALELASPDTLKHRLIKAFSSHLEELDLDNLPADLRTDFKRLTGRLTAVQPLRGETAVSATVRKMSNEEARSCAQEILELMANLAEQRGRSTPARSRQVLSLYSAEG